MGWNGLWCPKFWFVYIMEMNVYNHLILQSTWTGFPKLWWCFAGTFPSEKYLNFWRNFLDLDHNGYLILRHTHMISQTVRTESQISFICFWGKLRTFPFEKYKDASFWGIPIWFPKRSEQNPKYHLFVWGHLGPFPYDKHPKIRIESQMSCVCLGNIGTLSMRQAPKN